MAVKFHYYGAQGRGQQIRFTLVQGGIDFEDDSAPFPCNDEVKAKWAQLGGNSTTNVPMLEMPDGKTYTQSTAVLRHAARKVSVFESIHFSGDPVDCVMQGGLYPSDDEAAYAVDNMIAAVDDLRSEGYKPIFPCLMGNPNPELIAHYKDTVIPAHFANFERLLGDNDFFCGDVSVADMTMFDVLNNFAFNLFPSIKANWPKLSAFYDRVAALEKINAYMESDKYKGLMAFPCLE